MITSQPLYTLRDKVAPGYYVDRAWDDMQFEKWLEQLETLKKWYMSRPKRKLRWNDDSAPIPREDAKMARACVIIPV